MESGPVGGDGLDVQSPVEVDPDQDQGHVTTQLHNMEEINVLEVPPRMATVTLTPVLVRIKFH